MTYNKLFPAELTQKIQDAGIIAVLEVERVEDAVPVAHALTMGGITVIELALRTEAAVPSIREIKQNVPEMIVGAGTIIFPEQVESVIVAGADFGVSPGCNSAVIKECIDKHFPFGPGIATPTELEMALSFGARLIKFFPAEPMGGVSFLKSMNAPYNYLHVSYIPLGGVSEQNLHEYAQMPQVAAIGGSWIAKRDAITKKDWSGITARAEAAIKLWKQCTGTV